MAHWLMQLALLAAFVLVSASVEYRRTGLILAGFAALYLGLNAFNETMDGVSPPLYAIFYAIMDLAAARLVLLYGSKGARLQTTILCAFATTHIMAWFYASGLYSPLDPQRYVVLTMALATLQIVAISPGIKDGLHEIQKRIQKTLAQRDLRTLRPFSSPRQHLPVRDELQPIRGGFTGYSGGSGDSVLHPSPLAGGQDRGDL